MGDVRNIHDIRLMYGSYATNGRCMERPGFKQLMYWTRQHYGRWSEHQEPTKHRPKNYLSAIGINFLTPSHTT